MTNNECLTTNNTVPSLRGTKQSRIIKKEGINNNEGCTTLAGVLDCFGRASLAMTGERLFAGVLDCFVPRNDERTRDSDNFAMTRAFAMTDKRLFAGVLDCFVPRNDERASDDERVFNYQLIQSCSSYNYLRCFPLRFRSVNPDSDKKKRNKKIKIN
jgi:hypothetical protein